MTVKSAIKLGLSAIAPMVLFNHTAYACLLSEHDIAQLLLAHGRAEANRCRKELATPQVVDALRIVDIYWARGTKNHERYALLSKKYKAILSNRYNVQEPGQYAIPLFELERVWLGYSINSVDIVSPSIIEISLQVAWEQEGYRGTMTYVLALVSEGGRWFIADVHF